MKRLVVESFGDKVQGVRLRGNPKNPEPESFRVLLPGGDVDIVRCDDGSYWVHVRVDDESSDDPERPRGKIIDGRLDVRGKHASETDVGDFADQGLYHLAVRVGLKRSGG